MSTHPWLPTVRDLTIRLTQLASVTGTAGETQFAVALQAILLEDPYFARHPEQILVEQTLRDPHERQVLYALVRGSSARTVILTGHFDVVETSDYGALEPLAFDPAALLPELIAALRSGPRNATEELALRDFAGGEFLPGRGVLDMKSGLAGGIAVLQRYAALPERPLNLLFIAVPDEEATSQGARSAVARLPSLAQQWGLDLVAAINLDVETDPDDSGRGQAVFLGSIGKLLPAVYFIGRQTHAGAALEGVNAALLAAELTRLVECNPALGDPHAADGELAAPPITLYQSDLRQSYNVTTPAHAWCAYNVLTNTRSAAAILNQFVALTRAALDNALSLLRARADQYTARGGPAIPDAGWTPRVYTYAQLSDLAHQRGGAPALQRVALLAQQLAADPMVDLIMLSQELTAALVREAEIEGPAAVVCIASLYYPAVALDAAPRAAQLRNAVQAAAERVSAASGTPIRLRPFFPGISDMSFFGCRDSGTALDAVRANTPAWGTRIDVDYGAAAALGLPVVNIGPWGREYHRKLERVHVPYGCGVVPELLWQVIVGLEP